ncbi:MAG: helix-turn-helix domain-containing protein [Oscillospiraceae bacterium]|nr:helix-turn-helix domain-containing protein [Oscillospiraceae bacterium]
MDNKKIGLRIEQRRKALGLTLEYVADEIGVAKSTIQRYEKGTIEKIKLPVIEAISRVLNVNPAWICHKSDRMERDFDLSAQPSNIFSLPENRSYPLIGTIACGEPILAVENVSEHFQFPDNINADFCLRCKGDSMINARIYDGDIVFIRKQEQVENGEIAAVRIGSEATLKRVYYTPGSDRITLRACNPLYGDMEYEGEALNDIEILGKAVTFLSAVQHNH